MTTIYRAETIGSLLRPNVLQEARTAWMKGTLPTHEFKRVEDRAVDAAVALQERVGLNVVTDGEMRRLVFTGTLTEAIDGLSSVPTPTWHWHGDKPEDELDFHLPVCVTGKIRRRRSLATEEFAYVRGQTERAVKMTLPSPLMLSLFWSPEHSTAAYRDPFALFADAVDILREEVRELATLGCRYIQIDAPEIATLVDNVQRQRTYVARGVSPERMLGEGIDMLNALVDAPGVTFGLHFCKGNNAGHWMSQGGYETISQQVFQRATKYDIFLLEYDDERSGSFEALHDIPQDKIAVLGLISTKRNDIESADALLARINEASQFFPREQLALSTQCGFASVFKGNPISEAAQEAKLRLVVNVAQQVWG
ncbi:MAG: cobalamin-independent methionine synthase II family protein [Candidatus Binatia bacterium]